MFKKEVNYKPLIEIVSILQYNKKLKMKIKGRTFKYLGEVLKKEGLDWKNVREMLSEEHRNLLPEILENIKDEEIFPLELYLEFMEKICTGKNKEFANYIGKKSAEFFFIKEMRIAERIKDIDWLISKDFLIGESFYAGGKYDTKRLSEREIRIKISNWDKINEFVEEKIKGFIQGIFERTGLKAHVSILSSPLKGIPYLELLIKW